jgi:hypothetical protein
MKPGSTSTRSSGTHILVVGDPNGVPVLLWRTASGVTTSVIGTATELADEKDVREHHAAVLVDEAEGPDKLVGPAKQIQHERPLTNVLADRVEAPQ